MHARSRSFGREALEVEDSRAALLARIVASSHFRYAPRMRELVTFLVDETIAGREEQLHEQLIGCSVFGRKPGYNSNEDNIVRVQMRQLRMKLDAYFAEQVNPTLVLSIPKGSYVPVFTHPSDADPSPADEESSPKASPAAFVPTPKGTGLGHRTVVIGLSLAVVVLITGVALVLALRQEIHRPETAEATSHHPLFAHLFDTAHPTHIVVADQSLEALLSMSGQSITLADYLRQDYKSIYDTASADLRAAMETVARRQATSRVDASVAAAILRLSEERGPRVSIKFARELQLRDLKLSHVILLGSKRSNPWVQLFEPLMNFSIEYDNGPVIQNRDPRPGETSTYRGQRTANSVEGYSIVAFLPNLNHDGNVLIIAGTSMNATEAAGEFITSATRAAEILQTIAPSTAGSMASKQIPEVVPFFEILLKTSSLAGVAKKAMIVSYRVIEL